MAGTTTWTMPVGKSARVVKVMFANQRPPPGCRLVRWSYFSMPVGQCADAIAPAATGRYRGRSPVSNVDAHGTLARPGQRLIGGEFRAGGGARGFNLLAEHERGIFCTSHSHRRAVDRLFCLQRVSRAIDS